MTTNFKHYNIRLERSQWDRLTEIAAQRKITPADLIRSALGSYLLLDAMARERNVATDALIASAIESFVASANLMTASQRRLARLNEFTHLALDVIIREQFPEYRDRLIATTDQRLEQYHGA